MVSKKRKIHGDEPFVGLPQPALRAMAAAGYTKLGHLARVTEADLRKLHGVGPSAIRILEQALEAAGLSFARKFATIDEYIETSPARVRAKLRELRRLVKRIVPEATEKISYQIPTFALNGSNLVHFAGYANHIGMYPSVRATGAFKKELARYERGKGTLHFALDEPLPLAFIEKVVRTRVEENWKKKA